MKIALVQLDIAWNDPETSVSRAHPLVTEAASQGAELILLPEMFSCGFSFPTGNVARRAYDSGVEALKKWSRTSNAVLAASIANPTSNSLRPRNTIVVVRNQEILGTYDKSHLFSFAKEDESYESGNAPLTLEINGTSFSFLICYDLRFPEMWSALADTTHVYCLLANWPKRRHHHWRSLLTARAIDNQAYVVGVNRVGNGGDLDYQGGSLAISPEGQILVEMDDTQNISVFEARTSSVLEYRSAFPTLRDRRSDLYENIRRRSFT